MDLCAPGDLRQLLQRHGFHFSKSMGQNFLIDPEIPRRIARESGADRGAGVVEIGPGVGALTRELAALAGRVVSIELDRRLLPLLSETLGDCPNVELLQGDALKTDFPALVKRSFPGLRPLVCANLPYNITAPAITALLEAECFETLTLMVQREVALRICAESGSGDYGAFSLLCQFYAQPEFLFQVPPGAFLPAPKVTSGVVRLHRRERPAAVEDPEHFFRVVRAAFGQRRKTLRNALSAVFPREQTEEALSRCGLPPDLRGERLTLEDFARLSQALREA